MSEANLILDNISKDAQEMVTTMTDIVWLINPQKDTMEKLSDRIQSFASNVLSAKDILLDINFDESLKSFALNMEGRKNIFLMVKEAVNNVAKYSDYIKVKINLEKQKDELQITVGDNGKGFDVNLKNNSRNGLRNMEQRADALLGKLNIQSKEGSGTSVSLFCTLKKLS